MGRVVKFDKRKGSPNRKINLRRPFLLAAAGAVVGGAVGYASLDYAPSTAMPIASGMACRIKGNVSITTGERIYHVPGQKYYTQTVISPSKGERYFCSEWEAWFAGWRKSKV